MAEIEIAVIINSYNRLELLKKAYASLMENLVSSGVNYVVIVFEAGSTDGSIEWLEKTKSDKVYVIKNSGQYVASFSEGVNTAVDYALVNFPETKYLLLYETDNYLKSNTPILAAKKLMESIPDIAAIGFTVKKHNGQFAGYGSKFPSLLSLIAGQQISFKLKLNDQPLKFEVKYGYKVSKCPVVYTSPLLIKSSIWEQVRGFDVKNFPFSDCDIDLAYRINKLGQSMYVLSSDDVIHDNLEQKSMWSEKRSLNFYRARFTYFTKHYGGWINLVKPLLFLMHSVEFLMLVILATVKKRNWNSVKTRSRLMKSVWSNYNLT